MTTATPTSADAVRFGTNLGRKFEAADVASNRWLKAVATTYALDTNDTFGFLAEMSVAARSRWGLSDAQAKGVLNTLMARQQPKADGPALPNVKDVPSARYRVVQEDGSQVAIRLDSAAWASDKPKGTRTIAIRTSEGWTNLGFVETDGNVRLWNRGKVHAPRLAPALTTVADGVEDGTWLVYALSYAQEGGNCSFCDKDLDTPESLTVGYGPTCAKKHSLPWGAKAEPMTVVLARLAAGPGRTPPPPSRTPAQPSTPPAAPKRKRTYDEVFGADPQPAPTPRPSLIDLARQIENGTPRP